MNRTRRRDGIDTSISFLDIICCGFGAIVLLLVIIPVTPIPLLQQSPVDQQAQIRERQIELFELRGTIARFEEELQSRRDELGTLLGRSDSIQRQIARIEGEIEALGASSAAASAREGELRIALQELTDEMQRLLGGSFAPQNQYVAGIPVDSEYIVFIVDTSGSMFSYAWPRVMQEMVNILDIYPQVKGMQILNDMGTYMFPTFRGQWIPDTPERRQVIINQLRNWNPFSNSSPVEGITSAIRTFYSPEHRISLYVFGDDFTGRSISLVLDTVAQLNHRGADGEPMVRIHTVGFPVQFLVPNQQTTGAAFAALMRDLAEQNRGSFVGLNSFSAE